MGWFDKIVNFVNPVGKDGWVNQLNQGMAGIYDYATGKMQADMNEASTLKIARYNEEANDRMFEKQRVENASVRAENQKYLDAVWEKEKAYNTELWNKQNEYNTPQAQMARLEAAGLNKNLMYGQGTTGNAAIIHSAEKKVSEREPAKASMTPAQPWRPGDTMMDGMRNMMHMFAQLPEMQGRALQNSLLTQSIIGVQLENARKARENALLESTGTSERDPWWLRFGGRIQKLLFGANDANDVINVKGMKAKVTDLWENNRQYPMVIKKGR